MDNLTVFDNTSVVSSCSGNFSFGNFAAILKNFDCFRYGAPFTILLVILFILVFVHGIAGNLVVVHVLIRRARMWSETNMFIFNLALSDLSVITFCLPASFFSSLFKPWILGDFICKLSAYVQGASLFARAYSLAAIAVDRYIAVRVHPNPTTGFTSMQTKHGVFVIWFLALSSTIPWALKFNIAYSELDQLNFCKATWDKQMDDLIYFIFADIIVRFLIPLVTIIIMTICIAWTIDNYNIPPHWSPAYHLLRKRKRVNILKFLVGLTTTFIVCWLPFYIVIGIEKATGPENSNKVTSEIYTMVPLLHLLAFLNSCVNPLLYAVLDKNFRISFESFFGSSPTSMPGDNRVYYRRRREEEGRFQEIVEIPNPPGGPARLEMNHY